MNRSLDPYKLFAERRRSRKRDRQKYCEQDGQSYRKRVRRSPYRIKVSNREAAAYQMLWRLGYSINQIAKAFGRSTSVVHRRIAPYVWLCLIKRKGFVPNDLRKLPRQIRENCARWRRWFISRFIGLWEQWIFGEEDEPP